MVTGDHGMVNLRPSEQLDLADHQDLAAGVTLLAGEPRARYIRTVPGRPWTWSAPGARPLAIGCGSGGGTRRSRPRSGRIGDIVAAAHGRVGIVERDVDSAQARLNGHHGSLTPAEQLVPFLMYRS